MSQLPDGVAADQIVAVEEFHAEATVHRTDRWPTRCGLPYWHLRKDSLTAGQMADRGCVWCRTCFPTASVFIRLNEQTAAGARWAVDGLVAAWRTAGTPVSPRSARPVPLNNDLGGFALLDQAVMRLGGGLRWS